MITVTVELGERSYPVIVGAGARHELASVLPDKARRVAVVTQAGIDFAVDEWPRADRALLGDGETSKNLASVEAALRRVRRRRADPRRRSRRGRRRSRDRRRRVRRVGLLPRDRGSARADDVARHDRRGRRRQDRRQPVDGQEPRWCVLAAACRAVRHRRAEPRCRRARCALDSASWRSTTSSPATTSPRCRSTSASRAVAIKAHAVSNDEHETEGSARHAQLRPHARPRTRDGG